MQRKRTVVLISGRGTNMAALVEAARDPDYPAEIVAVISNRADAAGLQTAAEAGIATALVDHKDYASKQEFEVALSHAIGGFSADLICLAGFMRLLSPAFTQLWEGRALNIHPSLLPVFRGLHTHARALAEGVRIHGCTVHFLSAETDAGPIIGQAAVPVLPDDTEVSLAARVLAAEHRLYPWSLALIASGKARLEGGRVVLPGGEEAQAPLIVPAIAAGD